MATTVERFWHNVIIQALGSGHNKYLLMSFSVIERVLIGIRTISGFVSLPVGVSVNPGPAVAWAIELLTEVTRLDLVRVVSVQPRSPWRGERKLALPFSVLFKSCRTHRPLETDLVTLMYASHAEKRALLDKQHSGDHSVVQALMTTRYSVTTLIFFFFVNTAGHDYHAIGNEVVTFIIEGWSHSFIAYFCIK